MLSTGLVPRVTGPDSKYPRTPEQFQLELLETRENDMAHLQSTPGLFECQTLYVSSGTFRAV